MGASTSKESQYEARMPPLAEMEPAGILPEYWQANQPERDVGGNGQRQGGVEHTDGLPSYDALTLSLQLEFEKQKSNKSQVRDTVTGKAIYDIVCTRRFKTQVLQAKTSENHQRKVLLNIYESAWTSNWEVKGDTTRRGANQIKPFLFDVTCHSKRNPTFKVKFRSNGKETKWSIKHDKERRSWIVTKEDNTMIAHGGLRRKSFATSTGFVLTVAPGIDQLMLVTAFLCIFQYSSTHRHRGAAFATAGIFDAGAGTVGAMAAAASSGGGGGGGGGC